MSGAPSLFTFLGWLLQATAKGSVAILLIAIAQRLIGQRVRARWRHALWLVIVLRLLVPTAPSSIWSIFNLVPPHPGIQWQLRGVPGQIVFQGASIQVPWWIAGWRWVVAVWLCGIVVVAVRALTATLRMHRLVERARNESAASWIACQLVEEGRRQLGIARPVRVVETPLVAVPSLHGVLRPTLLLPEDLSAAFGRDELRHVILHELWHLRRHDVAVNWLLTAVRAVHWFNPLVWFAISRIEEERELVCDELTLSCLREKERFDYGRTMLKLLDRFRSPESVPALVGSVNSKGKMLRRLAMISSERGRSPLAMPLLAALTVVCLLAFTDARGEDQRSVARLDPEGVRTLQRFDELVSFDLTGGSFADLLQIVAAKSGVPVTQSAAIANSPVQSARFTLHERNVPADAVLIEALRPFHVVPAPNANGVTITNGPLCLIGHDARLPAACRRKTDGSPPP